MSKQSHDADNSVLSAHSASASTTLFQKCLKILQSTSNISPLILMPALEQKLQFHHGNVSYLESFCCQEYKHYCLFWTSFELKIGVTCSSLRSPSLEQSFISGFHNIVSYFVLLSLCQCCS